MTMITIIKSTIWDPSFCLLDDMITISCKSLEYPKVEAVNLHTPYLMYVVYIP